MTEIFPVVIEREENGTYSAWIAGMPGVYAAADTVAGAKRAIRSALTAHIDALRQLGREVRPNAEVLVLRASTGVWRKKEPLRYAGLGALMGRKTSAAKAEAARVNGRKGGRPRRPALRPAR